MLLNIFLQTTIAKAIQNFLISSQKAKFIDVPAGCMTSGVFRGKESSSRIKLSRLVQDLLNFCDLGSLQLLGVGGQGMRVGVGGWWWDGGFPHTCAHACMVNMIISCKWLPPLDFWGIPVGIPYDVIHVQACMHACACVWGTSHHPPPTSTHPQNQ